MIRGQHPLQASHCHLILEKHNMLPLQQNRQHVNNIGNRSIASNTTVKFLHSHFLSMLLSPQHHKNTCNFKQIHEISHNNKLVNCSVHNKKTNKDPKNSKYLRKHTFECWNSPSNLSFYCSCDQSGNTMANNPVPPIAAAPLPALANAVFAVSSGVAAVKDLID